MQLKISPSMMCADITELTQTLDTFEQEAIDYLHIDIMDGHFVPNFTLGTDYCKSLKKLTSIPLDIHLMVERPEDKLHWFPFGKGDIVSVHYESTTNLQNALTEIRKRDAKPFVVLNPATPIVVIEDILDDIDGVMLMAVNPGFAGQKMVPSALDKIRRLRTFLDERGYGQIEIEVDGNVSFENAVKMRKAGGNILVAGTSSIFHKAFTLADGIRTLRENIEKEVSA